MVRRAACSIGEKSAGQGKVLGVQGGKRANGVWVGAPPAPWVPTGGPRASTAPHSRTWGRAVLREDTALPQKAALLAQARTLAILDVLRRSVGGWASRQRSERLWVLDGPTWNEKIAAPS